jgi:hypothetical protein
MHNLSLLLQAAQDGNTITTSFNNNINSLITSKRFKAMVKEVRLLRDVCYHDTKTQTEPLHILTHPVKCQQWKDFKTIEYENMSAAVVPQPAEERQPAEGREPTESQERIESRERSESRFLGDDIGNMSMDEVLNNTIVFEEEYENSLIAISRQLENLEGDVMEMQSTEDVLMNYTTSPTDIEMWTDGLHKAMEKITKLNDAAIFYTKLNILFDNNTNTDEGTQSPSRHNGTLMEQFQHITNTITGLL